MKFCNPRALTWDLTVYHKLLLFFCCCLFVCFVLFLFFFFFFMSNNYTKEFHMNEKLSEVLCGLASHTEVLRLVTRFSSPGEEPVTSLRTSVWEVICGQTFYFCQSWKLNKRQPTLRALALRPVFANKKMRKGCGKVPLHLKIVFIIGNPLCMYERSSPWFEKAFI